MTDIPLNCQNPHHPPGVPRNTMVCINETPVAYVFGCEACLTIRRLQSIQVKTKALYRREVRRQLAKSGQLLTSRPAVNRKFQMDESLRGPKQ